SMTAHRSRALTALLLALAALLPRSAGADPGTGPVYRVPVTGVVEMGLAPFVERSLKEAEQAGAAAVVLDIDTPGGRIDAAEQITDALRDAKVPTYAYVNRRALSAGAMIALATDGVYMRPGSVMGAATPVDGSGQKLSEKMVSAMRSEFRALAEERRLDPRVAEAMVDEEIEIPGVVAKGKLLTLSTEEAARLGYARPVQDWGALVQTVAPAAGPVVEMRVNWAERVVRFFTHPLVAPFLLTLGFLGLLIELKTPAFGMAGLAGAASLGLFFGSHLLIGLAGWEVLILLAVGIVLLLVELLVLPGFGVAGVLGIGALLGAIVLSMLGAFPTTLDVLMALWILSGSVLMVALIGWQVLKRLPADRRARNLLLQSAVDREAGYLSAPVRHELVGAEGVALTDLRPSGTGAFGEERVDVVSSGGFVPAGTPIRVVRAEGYRHVVTPIGA
ncbi:MAG: ATP-dependent Clp protease proteolytic subunit, partial [Gemmatimonadota bacterium]|nr:ATP-dependent Clp protease proteolytic subunit [Gemmatimonadota bacterium]